MVFLVTVCIFDYWRRMVRSNHK